MKTIQVPDFVLFAMIMQESRGNVYVKVIERAFKATKNFANTFIKVNDGRGRQT